MKSILSVDGGIHCPRGLCVWARARSTLCWRMGQRTSSVGVWWRLCV